MGVKRPGREADHSPPSSAEVNKCVELYLHSPIRLHGVMLQFKKGTGAILRDKFKKSVCVCGGGENGWVCVINFSNSKLIKLYSVPFPIHIS
jgi:hypothetical protein